MNDDPDRLPDPLRHEYPNYPEVSGTTLPLLATVLAGFAVTIIIQLTLSPAGAGGLAVLAEVSLVAFLLSLLAFLSATAFAVNAQANNYLPFIDSSDTTRQFMQIDDPDAWLQRIERRWQVYHRATLFSFYGGVILLLGGVNLLLWEYAGTLVAVLFLVTAVASLAINVLVSRFASQP